jgi:hypothetical protein
LARKITKLSKQRYDEGPIIYRNPFLDEFIVRYTRRRRNPLPNPHPATRQKPRGEAESGKGPHLQSGARSPRDRTWTARRRNQAASARHRAAPSRGRRCTAVVTASPQPLRIDLQPHQIDPPSPPQIRPTAGGGSELKLELALPEAAGAAFVEDGGRRCPPGS